MAASEPNTADFADPFQPTWGRAAFTVVVATGAFFVPQEIPLEYYPLNNPSSGLNYLEITCAANVTGETQIYLDIGKGLNELDKIQIPIGPSDMAFTYTFPLWDAPLHGIRLDPFKDGPGELRITNFRIINRREEQIHRIGPADFKHFHNLEAVVPTEEGWKLKVAPGAKDPSAMVDLGRMIVPEGMNERNLKRCLLSTSYLTMMLWIILLAVYSALRLATGWRGAVKASLFLLLCAFCFSVAGNRGLIKNSVRYSRHG